MDHRKVGSIYQPQRKLKVIVIGAGASGLLLAYKIQRHFDEFELKIFEKNPEISGTWFENRYPGLA
jgi:cyclohexanone monooxygenase